MMKMEYRAITIDQPWASLIAMGLKNYILRDVETDFRGHLFIYSSKKPYNPNAMTQHPKKGMIKMIDLIEDIFNLSESDQYHEYNPRFRRAPLSFNDTNFVPWKEFRVRNGLPRGKIVATAVLTYCFTSEEALNSSGVRNYMCPGGPSMEQLCGDWQANQYALYLSDIQSLSHPLHPLIPIVGRGRLFTPRAEIIEEVKELEKHCEELVWNYDWIAKLLKQTGIRI